jgi:hypothetical protein
LIFGIWEAQSMHIVRASPTFIVIKLDTIIYFDSRQTQFRWMSL